MQEGERRNLAKQIANNNDLFRQIEEFLAHRTIETVLPQCRVGLASDRYRMTSAFDDPLPEFEVYM